MNTQEGLVDSFFQVFNTEMPLRNFTLRLYSRLLLKIKPHLNGIEESQGGMDLTRY